MPGRSRWSGPPRSRRRRGLGGLALRAFGFSLLLVVASGAALAALYLRELLRDLPSIEPLSGYRPPVASQIYSADGELMAELYLEKRYLVPLAEIPLVVRQAFLAAEDASFYEHRGIDLQGILRAAWHNLKHGEATQGGSTITQQVVKSLLLTPQKSYERKLKEIVLSRRLERRFNKDEILELYLNQIYLGAGAYGVEAAANEYFGKSVRELGLHEAALLAGLPQAPSRYSPLRHPERAKARQRYVLRRMEEAGFITAAERERAEAQPLRVAGRRAPAYRAAPDYVEYVRRTLEDRYGARAPYQLGLRIYTAADLAMQRAAEQAVRDGLEALDKRRGFRGPVRRVDEAGARELLEGQTRSLRGSAPAPGTKTEALVVRSEPGGARLRIGPFVALLRSEGMAWAGREVHLSPGDVVRVRVERAAADAPLEVSLDQEPLVEGALLAMEPATGYVRAMVGGYDFQRSQFNRAVQALRQPGSAFKPLVYAAALDRGYTPASVVIDAPVVFDDRSGKLWKPENFDGEFHGPTRLREALTFSRNVVSVKVAQDIGLQWILSYLPRFGLSRPFPPNLSIALGSSEVTLLELVRAYAVFASGGSLPEPIFVTKITDHDGNVIEEKAPSAVPTLSPQTAYLMTSMLQEVVRRGTGRRARALGRPVAGKTGTTNDTMDAWFVGFTPDLVAGAWVGFDEKKPLGRHETGARAALPVWLEFMQRVLDGKPVNDFPVPDGIVCVHIDPRTGLRASADIGDPLLECFRRGTEPQRFAEPVSAPQPAEFFRGDF